LDAAIFSFSARIAGCSRSCSIVETLRPVSCSISARPSMFQGLSTSGFSQIALDPERKANRTWASCK
jgi:hypothetical protein